ncbi:MAG: hypothetical protein ACREI8_02265, partial [Myxococcota bacterium]
LSPDLVSQALSNGLGRFARAAGACTSWAWHLLQPADVTVRIMVEETGRRRVVRVEGRLTVVELAELEGALGEDLTHAELELQDLRSADAGGLAALRRLRAAGVALRSVPPRIALEIDEEVGCQPPKGRAS